MSRELFGERMMERGVGKRLNDSEVLEMLDQMREGGKEKLTKEEETEVNIMRLSNGQKILDRAKEGLEM